MKFFLDSAKLDEIKEAYYTFGIDGVTTNPKHIMLSGKPFRTDLGRIKGVIRLIPFLTQFPVPVSGEPVIAVGPDPVTGLVAFRALSDCVAEEIYLVRPDPFQFLFHGLRRDHVPMKVSQQNDLHCSHPVVQGYICSLYRERHGLTRKDVNKTVRKDMRQRRPRRCCL